MKQVIDFAAAVRDAGGRALLVGGYIRDSLLGFGSGDSKDFDIEVYGLPVDRVQELCGNRQEVGASFGVFKVGDLDISIPRTEKKTGTGHTGFQVSLDPYMSPERACLRRDFTINAISLDPLTGEIIDPINGSEDIKNKILRYTSPQFSEDPLRVLRGFQFVSRFGLSVDKSTLEVCRDLKPEFYALSKERVWGEFWKWASRGVKPSLGIQFLIDTGWLELFKPLHDMVGCPQDPEWHPEGCVMTHTCHVMDYAASFDLHRDQLGVLVMAALCHDIGKPHTTFKKDGRIVSPGHAQAGVGITRNLFEDHFSGYPENILEEIEELVGLHMEHLGDLSDRFIRRLCCMRMKKTSIDQLVRLMESDHSGRPPLQKGCPDSAVQLQDKVLDFLANQSAEPVLKGRDLLELGYEPGPNMGKLLKELYSLQVEDGLSKKDLLNLIRKNSS